MAVGKPLLWVRGRPLLRPPAAPPPDADEVMASAVALRQEVTAWAEDALHHITGLTDDQTAQIRTAACRAWLRLRRQRLGSGRWYTRFYTAATWTTLLIPFVFILSWPRDPYFGMGLGSLLCLLLLLTRDYWVAQLWAADIASSPRWHRWQEPAVRRVDRLLCELLALTGQVYRSQSRWYVPSVIRTLRMEVNRAADEVDGHRQTLQTLATRSETGEFKIVRQMLAEHRQLADIIRLHDPALATTASAADYTRICHSLRAGLLAASGEDWTALTENIAALPRTGAVRKALHPTPAGVIVSLVCTAIAVLLIVLPGRSHQVVLGPAGVLLVAAVMSFLGLDINLMNTVTSTVQQSTPAPKD